jgi:mRNA-degrading endonuclease HigB of HigAB toxin-antitoxin module
MGSVIKSDIVSHLADEHYVVRVEGRASRTIAVSTMRLEKAYICEISFRSML